MRRELIIGAFGIGLLAGSPAFAAGETTDLHVPPQTQTDVREWVVKNKPRAQRFAEPVVVGATLPSDVELATVPSEWGTELRPYSYVVADGRVHLVDPANRRVVYIIE